jgi:hypothetical protein
MHSCVVTPTVCVIRGKFFRSKATLYFPGLLLMIGSNNKAASTSPRSKAANPAPTLPNETNSI